MGGELARCVPEWRVLVQAAEIPTQKQCQLVIDKVDQKNFFQDAALEQSGIRERRETTIHWNTDPRSAYCKEGSSSHYHLRLPTVNAPYTWNKCTTVKEIYDRERGDGRGLRLVGGKVTRYSHLTPSPGSAQLPRGGAH